MTGKEDKYITIRIFKKEYQKLQELHKYPESIAETIKRVLEDYIPGVEE